MLACFISHTGIMNLVVVMIIFGVAVKVYRNFGGGLAQHCKCQKFITIYQGHPTDRFDKLSVRKAFNPL